MYIHTFSCDVVSLNSPFSEKGGQLENRDVIFFSQIFGPVFSQQIIIFNQVIHCFKTGLIHLLET